MVIGSLVSVEEVKLASGITSGEISDGEIASQILHVTRVLLDTYGNPMQKSYITVVADELSIDFTGDKREVYRIDHVEVAGSSLDGTGSYTEYLTNGSILVNQTIVDDFTNERLEVEWIPMKAHLLAKDMTALRVLENLYIVTGDDATSTKIQYFTKSIDVLSQRFLEDVNIILSTQGETWDRRQGTIIVQNYENQY